MIGLGRLRLPALAVAGTNSHRITEAYDATSANAGACTGAHRTHRFAPPRTPSTTDSRQSTNVRSYFFALAITVATAVPTVARSQRLVGTVTDSVHHSPLSDATVVATAVNSASDSVFHTTRTDAKGRFALDSLRPGRYSISVEHAFTDSIGLDVPSRIVAIAGNGTTNTALALPSVTTLRRTLCPTALKDTSLGVLLGVVRQQHGAQRL